MNHTLHGKDYIHENFFVSICVISFTLAMNEKIKQSYKMARIKNLEELACFTLYSQDTLFQPDVELYLMELKAVLKLVKDKLAVKQRQALELSQATETSLDKASQTLRLSPETLRCRLRRTHERPWKLFAPILIIQ